MKNYKQILEAVNRGIRFALDDFEDQEDIQGQTNSKVKYKGGTKEWLDLMNEVVDLGLPSGTLWCKYNLGCDTKKIEQFFKQKQSIKMQNHGKYLKTIDSKNISLYTGSPELWYGDFYAWGEIEPDKPEYDMKSYKFGNGSGYKDELTKYVTLEKFTCNPFNDDSEILTWVDNLTELQENDDAAYQNKKVGNYKFHIPTKEQFEELKKYTTYKTTSNYKGINFLAGGVFTSKINDEELFFPFAGLKDDDGTIVAAQFGYYWSSTLNTKDNANAYYLDIYSWDFNIDDVGRNLGFKIRPVINL